MYLELNPSFPQHNAWLRRAWLNKQLRVYGLRTVQDRGAPSLLPQGMPLCRVCPKPLTSPGYWRVTNGHWHMPPNSRCLSTPFSSPAPANDTWSRAALPRAPQAPRCPRQWPWYCRRPKRPSRVRLSVTQVRPYGSNSSSSFSGSNFSSQSFGYYWCTVQVGMEQPLQTVRMSRTEL